MALRTFPSLNILLLAGRYLNWIFLWLLASEAAPHSPVLDDDFFVFFLGSHSRLPLACVDGVERLFFSPLSFFRLYSDCFFFHAFILLGRPSRIALDGFRLHRATKIAMSRSAYSRGVLVPSYLVLRAS